MAKRKSEYHRQVNWFHPFRVVGRHVGNDELYDGTTYGLDLDLQTTLSYHTYEYGKIFTVRILGFGFEYALLEF